MRKEIPPNSVVLTPVAWDRGSVVADGTMRNGVPFIVVVLPLSPVGASDNGIVVGPGNNTNGVPEIKVVLTPGISPGAIGNVVAAGTMMKGVPPMIVVLPWTPAGAPATGIVVGSGMTKP